MRTIPEVVDLDLNRYLQRLDQADALLDHLETLQVERQAFLTEDADGLGEVVSNLLGTTSNPEILRRFNQALFTITSQPTTFRMPPGSWRFIAGRESRTSAGTILGIPGRPA